MDKSEFRVLIKHCFLVGRTTVETKQWLDRHYSGSAPAYSTIKYWFVQFRRDRTTTTDAPRSGRPHDAVTPRNIKKIREIVLNNRKLKLIEIAKLVGISKERVFHIMHECLHMQKLCTQWVPRELTIDEKQERVNKSERCLRLLTRNKKDFFMRYVTMEEIYIRQTVMAAAFWDANGLIFIDYYEQRTTNNEYYMVLLERLKAEIVAKRPKMKKKQILFHHDHTPCQGSVTTMAKMNELNFELVPHPPLSPDLSPSNYWLIPALKKTLSGKKFTSNNEVIAAAEAFFDEQDSLFYWKGVEMLEKRWTDCIARDGNYIDE